MGNLSHSAPFACCGGPVGRSARLTVSFSSSHRRADPAARLAAELGVLAFYAAFARWVDPANQQTFTDLARQALHELRAATATLD